MGYTTEFSGGIRVDPPLNEQEIEYLNKFAGSRRMDRTKGPYFVDGNDDAWPARKEADILDYNRPPVDQPSLWCNWVPTADGLFIVWNEAEKFYDSARWMKYIIDHFIGNDPIAQEQLPFLEGHTCSGTIRAQGEHSEDTWKLYVEDNVVSVAYAEVVYGQPEKV